VKRLRRILGALFFALAGWWSVAWLRETMRRSTFRFSVDAETGEPYGLRITPLTPAERLEAIDREWDAQDQWSLDTA